MVNPINGAGNGGMRIKTGRASFPACKLGPKFILTADLKTAILNKAVSFYGVRPINVAETLPVNREAMDAADHEDMVYSHSPQLSLIKQVLLNMENKSRSNNAVQEVSSLRDLLKGVNQVNAADDDKDCMRHVLSSMILTYSDLNKVPFKSAFETILNAGLRSENERSVVILELKSPPRFKDLVDLVQVRGKVSIFFEALSRRSFILWDMLKDEMAGFDVSYFARKADWKPARFSLFAKLDIDDQMDQSGPRTGHIKGSIERGLERFFSFGSRGIYHYNMLGHGVPLGRVKETGEFFRWENIPGPRGGHIDLGEEIGSIFG